jgi:membrane protease YdiL (CAAX protease family)
MMAFPPEGTVQAPVGLDRKVQLVEVCVFLLLIVPSLVLSLFVIRRGNVGFVVTVLAVIFRDLALVGLLLFFLWRNGESVRRVGWTIRNWWREAALGAALFIPFFFVTAWLDQMLLKVGLPGPSKPLPSFLEAQANYQFVLATVLVVVVALAEETIFRGYLLLRLSVVTRSVGIAVLLSSVIFSLGHGYEGSVGLVTVGVMGVFLALVYVWRGSLVAPIVMHLFQDLLGIVLLPWLSGAAWFSWS